MESGDSEPGPSQRSFLPERMSRLSRRTMAADLVASSSNGAAECPEHQDQPRDVRQLSEISECKSDAAAAAATAGKLLCTNCMDFASHTQLFAHTTFDKCMLNRVAQTCRAECCVWLLANSNWQQIRARAVPHSHSSDNHIQLHQNLT